MPVPLTLARPLVFGGNLYCGNRLGLAGLAAGAATASRVAQGIALRSTALAPLLVDGSAIAQRDYPLAGVTALIAGHTRLRIAIEGDQLLLRPVSHVALYTQPHWQLPDTVAWHWQQRDAWTLAPAALWPATLLLLGALALCAWRACGGSSLVTWRAAGGLLAGAGVAALLLARGGNAPGIGMSLVLAWAALWYLLLAPGKLQWLTIAAVLLLASGVLAQLELGLGGAESSWLRHVQKTACLLAIGAGLAVQPRLMARSVPLALAMREWILLVLAALALAALLLQVAFGDETGVFDIQPVEFAKLALTALSAHCLALGMGTQAHAGGIRRWVRLAAPALLFIALLAMALVQVDDFSPLILLLVWSTAMALAYACASRNVLLAAALGLGAAVCVGGVAFLHSAGPAEVANWQFYGDRFLVWLDPATHPHTGQQMLAGGRAIAAGGWWGSDGLGGLTTLGQPAGSALRIRRCRNCCRGTRSDSWRRTRRGACTSICKAARSAARIWNGSTACMPRRRSRLMRCRPAWTWKRRWRG